MQLYALKTFGIEFLEKKKDFTAYSTMFWFTANKNANARSLEPG